MHAGARGQDADLRLLGPLQLSINGRAVELGTAKQRHTLAALAVTPGGPVSTDLLMSRLWGDRPPAHPEQSVYSYVARIRKAILTAGGSGRLVRRCPGGYTLDLPAARVDFLRFRQYTSAARQAARGGDLSTARSQLARALALFAGPPMVDVDCGWAHNLRAQLERERLAARTLDLELALRSGDPDDAMLEAAELAAANPLNERLAQLYLLALCAAGQRAEALAYYGDLRERLLATLGIEPGPQLEQLFLSILRGQAQVIDN